ncbi:MAG: GntR family transcriptional regulator [Bacillota bacterium]|jgi:GntR family transcriptional regulator|nr:GntR family transcriptional regulator [Bacillota bacterium]HOB90954.1 GntR family transcriptional regulator [Bacillota bacterium]HPZ54998.1 GntR family transcriptional regulator [Bacillota bacterium]HQD17983.1 GntR family transcriptional regulator [Bacillota bacterium]
MRIRVDVSRPIYQQMIDEVKRAIARGELKPGDKLPSHRDMAQEIRVNPNTVQRAYREMEQGGLVQTLRGLGTFISDDPTLVERTRDEMARRSILAFVQEMRALGFSPADIVALVEKSVNEFSDGQKDLRDSIQGIQQTGVINSE